MIQKGRPFQNPARPVLILQARPITKIPTSAIPTKIVNLITPLRATVEEETQGLDLRQHGEQIN